MAVPVHDQVRRCAQTLGVDRTGQLDDLLDDVRVDVGVGGVEVDARLQRRRRQDVDQVAEPPWNASTSDWRDRDEREVRGVGPLTASLTAMALRASTHRPRECLHPSLIQHAGRPTEGGLQVRAVVGLHGDGVDLDGPRQRHPGIAVLGDARPRRGSTVRRRRR